MHETSTTVLTISRHLGSGGSFIGHEVARRLGMRYADREILQRAATMIGAKEDDLEKREERVTGFWESVLRSFSFGAPDVAFAPPALPTVYDEDLFTVESRIIREIASRYDAVIVGRGGFHVLAHHPGAINIMVHAAKAWRIGRVMRIYGARDTVEAEQLIERSDQQRARFIRTFTGKDWTDSSAFHLCIDTSLAGLEVATEVVATMVSRCIEGRKATGIRVPV